MSLLTETGKIQNVCTHITYKLNVTKIRQKTGQIKKEKGVEQLLSRRACDKNGFKKVTIEKRVFIYFKTRLRKDL